MSVRTTLRYLASHGMSRRCSRYTVDLVTGLSVCTTTLFASVTGTCCGTTAEAAEIMNSSPGQFDVILAEVRGSRHLLSP